MSDLGRPSVISLLAANLFPLYGVLVLGWDVFLILLVFWLENVTIGFFNVLRMLVASPRDAAAWGRKVFFVPFFCVHYGGFCAGHGVFVVAFFGGLIRGETIFRSLEDVYAFVRSSGLAWAVLGLFLSHSVSFVTNYLRKGEYRKASLDELMMRPYGRVVILHLTILFGGAVAMALHSPVWALVILIALKVMIDLGAHLREREKLGRARGPGTEPAAAGG
jgi:hypothetical protein